MKKVENVLVPTSYGEEVEVKAVLINCYLQLGSLALVKLYYGQNRLFEIVEAEDCGGTHIIAEYCTIPEYDELLADIQQDLYEAAIK